MKISTEKDAILEAARLTLEIDRLEEQLMRTEAAYGRKIDELKSLNAELLATLESAQERLSESLGAWCAVEIPYIPESLYEIKEAYDILTAAITKEKEARNA